MAKFNLKPLDRQVIVVTGASSGIGLATAISAAQRGAQTVFLARSEDTMADIVNELSTGGASAIYVAADVAHRPELEAAVDAILNRYGRIDTWVNNAGVAIYGKLVDNTDGDARRLFDINYWGVVNGSLIALPHLRAQGGALINVGSEVSEAVVPLLGHYSASKHAVKGFTDTLRIELELEDAAVSVTLIQPTATNTPFPEHARNYMDKEPKLPNPQIDPQKVADVILDAAVNPARDVKVGAMAKINTATAKFAPRIGDWMAGKQAKNLASDKNPKDPEGTLHKPGHAGRTHGISG